MLLVDDDPGYCDSLASELRRQGFEVRAASGAAEARAHLATTGVDALLVERDLREGSALEFVRWALANRRTREAYCMATGPSVTKVVEAMRAGCGDVLEKPLDVPRFAALLEANHAAFTADVDVLTAFRARFAPGLVGDHPRLLEVIKVVRNVAETNCTVLITGESGTGKEVVARAIHDASPRHEGPFVAMNCAAIPDNLIEDELFGHARGAFTSANGAREGRLLSAAGGTLFLDEIGDMPLAAQAKMLRVLQDRRVTPVGSDRAIPVDVRVLAATNKRLEDEVQKGSFRADLCYRLSVIPLKLPPLRERALDILPLARHFLDRANLEHGRGATGFDPCAERALTAHAWPGNVRELGNAVERAVVLRREGGLITEPDLMLPQAQGPAARPTPVPQASGATTPLNLKSAMDAVERQYIEEALERTGGNRTEAAALLGLNRSTLVEKIRKFA